MTQQVTVESAETDPNSSKRRLWLKLIVILGISLFALGLGFAVLIPGWGPDPVTDARALFIWAFGLQAFMGLALAIHVVETWSRSDR